MSGSTTRWSVLAVAVLGALAVAPASLAQGVTDPRDAVKAVTDAADGAAGGAGVAGTSGSTAAVAPAPPPQPTEDNDSGAHETSDPSGPDHASGSVVNLDVAGEDAVDVGSTDAEAEDDGHASGDVTVLAVGGNEIAGAHSDSGGGPPSDAVDPLEPVCEGSGGGVCVGLLFAETSSTQSGGSSSAESQAALAFACLGGTDPDAGTACDGVVGVGLGTSTSEVSQDNQAGDTTAEQKTAVADACVGGEDDAGVCSGIGVEVLAAQSSSEAPSPHGPGSSATSSCTADIQAGGSSNCVLQDPEALELPPGCPEGQSLLCLYVNQGETFVFIGGAGSHQEALHLSLLPGAVEGADLIELHVADAETLATNAGAQPGPDVSEDDVSPRGQPAVSAGGSGGPGLAFTGLPVAGLAAAVMVLGSAGAAMLVAGRRRAGAAPQIGSGWRAGPST